MNAEDEIREDEIGPPVVRGDCVGGIRPCPWVRCRHHLIWAFPKIAKLTDDEIVEQIISMPETCVLDCADRGGMSLLDVGNVLGITRERVRQLEFVKGDRWRVERGALAKLRNRIKSRHILEEFAFQ